METISTFDPELLKEGDEIAKDFYSKIGREFNLKMEKFCQKIWDSWFKAGGWHVKLYTQPQSEKFQIEELNVSEDVKSFFRIYLRELNFPKDGRIVRSNEQWDIDFKFRPNTRHFIGIEYVQYMDAYHHLFPFLFLIWCNDRKKRYILQPLRHPSECEVKTVRGVRYFDVTRDCVEIPPQSDVPIKGEIPQGLLDYLAFRLRLNELAAQGIYPAEIVPIQSNFEDAKRLIECNLQLHKAMGLPRRLREAEIEMIRGKDVAILKRIWPHKEVKDVNICGFDTEFYEDRLLSVQFATIDKDGNLRSKCIMDDLEGYDAKRLLNDVIVFLKECGLEPKRRIYLIAHFAVADLGHLANCLRDFKFRQINKALHAEFIMPEDDEVEFKAKDVKIEGYKMKVIDLFAYYPSSLSKIGQMLNHPKVEIDRTKILNIYENQRDEFVKYATRDAEIALLAFLRLREFARRYNVEILRCPSIASLAADIFRINYLKNHPSPVTFKVEFKSYKTPSGIWSKRKIKRERYGGRLDLRNLALLCLWGGRAECYVHGLIKGDFILYDIISLYPIAASLQALPNENTRWIEITKDNFDSKMEGFICVKFKFPNDTRYPCLPVAGNLEEKLYFPLSGTSYCTIAELREALKMGCKIEDLYGFGFYPSENEINHDLKAFMQDMLKHKVECEKGSIDYELYKTLANAMVGKLAQRNSEDDISYAQWLYVAHGIPLARTAARPSKPGPCFEPIWSALVLGRARSIMSQFICKGALMTVTDSVLLPANVSLECEALDEIRSVGSDLKVEVEGIKAAFIVRTRLYCLMDEKGEILKEAHHAVRLDSSQVKEIFKKSIEAGYNIDVEGHREHVIRLREALEKGKQLGSSELRPSKIYFRWDWKRILCNPSVDMFRGWSDTRPIDDVVKYEDEIFEFLKYKRKALDPAIVQRARSLRDSGMTYKSIADELKIPLSRVRRILKEEVKIERPVEDLALKVYELRCKGLSYRAIAKELSISLGRVQRLLKSIRAP